MEEIKTFNKIIVPICLVISFIGFAFFLYLAIQPNDLKSPLELVFPMGACLATFAVSLWYCRTRLGWFKRRV
jgi:hypothetical protein